MKALLAGGWLALCAVAAAAQTSPAPAPASPAAGSAAPAIPAAPVGVPSWLHVGSDIPADPAWRTGTLPNGVRYAVRRDALPAGTIAIRVRMDAGSLMGDPHEAGWAHLIEHMTFRGTAHYGDGEGSRIWQRLGASFGSDSNAFTSPRATTYVLDLPRADAASYREAMGVIAEMVQSARIDPAALAVERNVVLAERAARLTPLAQKLEDANRALVWPGLKMARYPMIGTPATLAAADAPHLRAWYKRWYRPERAVVVVVGDADPALLEAVVRERFGDWKGEGARPAEPDYGSPHAPARPVAVIADPQAANADELVWVSPHDEAPWTIARQQRQYVDYVADAIVRRRLASAAQAGGAIVNAGAGRSLGRHIQDQFSISFLPRPGQTRAALDQLFAILNDLRVNPPSQAEVDGQILDVQGGLAREAENAQTAQSAALANGFVGAVDNGDVAATRRFYLSLFLAQKKGITPDAVHRALATTLAGDPRLVHLTSTGADAGALAADLTAARAVAGGHQAAVRAVSMAEVAVPGPAGTVAARTTIADLGIERVRFANGVTLDYKKTGFEKDAIRLRVQVGHGVLDRPAGDAGLFWTAGALTAAGIGPFTRDELTKLTDGRQIGFSMGAGTTGVQMVGQTNRRDMADALRLMTAGLTQMRYAEGPVARLRDSAAATYQTLYGQPGSVLGAFGTPWLYGGDTRFRGIADQREIAALTLPDFQRFWTDQLARGPIRIEVVGDLDGDALVTAVAASFGALPPRPDTPPTPGQLAVTARAPAGGVPVLRHRGDPDQATVVRVYPTPGGQPDIAQSRALSLAAAILEQRLVEEFREKDGGTYSPSAGRATSTYLPGYGRVAVVAQLRLARIADFQTALDRITADLAANGPGADALARAKATQIAALERARSSDNGYWLGILSDDLADPRDTDAVRTAVSGRQAITADDVRVAAARWLTPANSFSLSVLPTAAPVTPAGQARARTGAARRHR
jgi:zinc protease